ncbi:MAG: sulfatase-like hydrolase/transferase [Polyangiaceae bacterium]|nr:sulfatase-like hydrolase/transferase [Polyangiaceae bacterium]
MRPRNILFITTDQQRYEALGCNGGRVARTPVADGLARDGIRYERAHTQNVVCMPSRATMITGQYPRTHGVVANGIALPEDAPNVMRYLKRHAGYRTALLGKAHFQPVLDLGLRFRQNRLAAERSFGPWLDFDHLELAVHGPVGATHYGRWLAEHHPEDRRGFAVVLTATGGGDTGAPEVAHNPIPRARYHTDWVVDRTMAWLDAREDDEPWFVWMSFPDPHHPWDPPASELGRVPWRDLELPPGRPRSRAAVERVLADKPAHWLAWYQGRYRNPEGGPATFRPASLGDDQLREITAMIHIENELIDEATGRVLARLVELGLDRHTDVFFTTDHGDLQGDLGLLYKGPYHVDGLMRVPLLWRPAPAAGLAPAVVKEPVGLVDLAPTFCTVAGLPVPDFMEGAPLPVAPGSGRERVITEWDSQFRDVGMHLRTLYRDDWLVTIYLPSTRDEGGHFPVLEAVWPKGDIPRYDGTEGELYDLRHDPHAWRNLWNDPAHRRRRDELVADLRASLRPGRPDPLPVASPV